MRHAATDDDVLAIFCNGVETIDAGGIDDSLEGPPQAAPGLHEQVGAAAYDARTTVVTPQDLQCCSDRVRRVIIIPGGCHIISLCNN